MPLFTGEMVNKKHPEQVFEAPIGIKDTIEEYMEWSVQELVNQYNDTAPPDRYVSVEDFKFVTVKESPRYA